MMKKSLALMMCLSLALVACKDSIEDNIKSNKSASSTAEKVNELFKAKVFSRMGDVKLLKVGAKEWKDLRVTQYVLDNDRVRTAEAAEAVLNALDGTVFVISEKSDVEFNTAFKDSVRGEVNVFIRNGNIQFDVQKQKNKQINFSTGTATASIRGTAGFVGSLDGQLVASLKEGRVEVKDAKGKTSNIQENQTIVVTKSGEAKTIQLESSGSPALIAALDGMVKAGGLENVEELEKSLQNFDEAYVEEKKKFEQSIVFEPVSIPAKISKPSITLKAKLTPGIYVTVMGVTDTVPPNGVYERTFTWDEHASGEKRFIATCSDGSVEVACNTWNTDYVNLNPEEDSTEDVEEDTLSMADSLVTDSLVADSLNADSTLAVAVPDSSVSDSSAVDSAKAAEAQAVAVNPSPAKVRKAHPHKFGLVIKLPPADGAEVLGTDAAGQDTLEFLKVPKGEKTVDTDLKIMLSGIKDSELKKIDTIFIFCEGQSKQVITNVNDSVYTLKVSLQKRDIAKYEVAAKLKDESYVCAFKTFIAN